MMEYLTILLVLLVLYALISSARIIRQYEKGVVLRLGKYTKTVDSGVVFLIPFIESVLRVDMREKVINVEPQKVITKDNVTVTVDAVIYYKIVDPVKTEFEVEDFGVAATTLAQTNLRNLIGDKSLDETLVARDIINTNLREVLDEATNSWGVKVTRVEVQKIDPPQDITDAMSQQMKAEREKRASILEAEGVKQSEILAAEGQAQARILEAESQARSQIMRAEAQAESLKQIAESAEKYFTPKAQMLKKLEVTEKVMVDSAKWVLPESHDLVTVLNLHGDEKTTPLPIRK
ncbi:MAG: Band 7 protein [Microgenomates group bacterium GW2011_GWF2_45_18]|nr:MAG: Band 7 protein [Microgenomates group bacterium GW2011_GWF1_44_10]KKU01955.1 MAG: Band 7 protein [Microgenomates group bacterium GW2011_GWF2_45_18]HAU99061.1 SPFH/Band 7/PHB domain protein [Candidatus Paceibacterota bacterium]HAX01224.1 SPFH/Band 7/PHB domain protein [Candidatus Paceibacterota bacterium]